jgi:hypothetical protein
MRVNFVILSSSKCEFVATVRVNSWFQVFPRNNNHEFTAKEESPTKYLPLSIHWFGHHLQVQSTTESSTAELGAWALKYETSENEQNHKLNSSATATLLMISTPVPVALSLRAAVFPVG